jgi:CheY-like chemotaxis protein
LVSEVGRGTTISVYLPVHEGSAIRHPRHADATPVTGNETILVAEDEPAVLRVVVRTLKGAGYRVLTASDGAEAVQLFQAHAAEIGLVLLDVVMPKMTGPDAAVSIRAIRPGVSVMFSTGYADAATTAWLQRDDTPVLHKPYPPAALLREVRRLLDPPQTD